MAKRGNVRPNYHTKPNAPFKKNRELWECIVDDTYSEYDRYLPGPQERAHYRRKRLDYIEDLKSKGFCDNEIANGLDVTQRGVLYTIFSDYEKYETSPQGIAQYKRKSKEYIDKINAKLREAHRGRDCRNDGSDRSDAE